MGLQAVANYIGEPGYQHPVENDRALIENIFGRREGVLGQNDFQVSQGTGLAVTVAGGATVIKGRENTTQGSYFAWSSGSEQVAWPGASASSRWDTLILRVVDPQYGAGATPGCGWEVIQGTPGSGVPPTDAEINSTFYKPGAWQRILDQQVDPVDTSQIQVSKAIDRRKFGLSSSGNILVWSESLLPTTGNEVGQGAWTLDTKMFYIWNGSRWESFRSTDDTGLGRVERIYSPTGNSIPAAGTITATGTSISNFVFKANREYTVRAKAQIGTGTSGTLGRITLSGASFQEMPIGWEPVSSGQNCVLGEVVAVFRPGSTDVTATISSHIQMSGTTAGTTVAGNYIDIYDEGRV